MPIAKMEVPTIVIFQNAYPAFLIFFLLRKRARYIFLESIVMGYNGDFNITYNKKLLVNPKFYTEILVFNYFPFWSI